MDGNEATAALVDEGRKALAEGTPDSNERAVTLFERALAADPREASAYAGLATAYLERASIDPDSQWHELAVAAGEKAVELDPAPIDNYLALAFAYRAKGALQQELEFSRRRVELDPGNAIPRIRLGWILWFTGRPAEALPWLRGAAAERPQDRWVHFFLGNANLALGDFEEAERSYRHELELYADHSSAHAGVIWSLLAAGADEAARSQLRLVQSSALDGDRYGVKVADIEYFLGEDASALRHARAAMTEEPNERYWPRGLLATTILGAILLPADPAAAVEHLQYSEQVDRARLDGGDEGYMPRIDGAAVAAIRGDARGACELLRAAIASGWRYGPIAARDRLFESLRSEGEFRSLIAG